MEKGITKKHSQMLYGVAILLMLYHHLFCLPERLGCEYFSVLGNLERELAWFGKMCVAIFSFISGYAACAFTKKSRKSNDSYCKIFVSDCKYSIRRVALLLRKVLLVFAIFIPMGILLDYIIFDWREFAQGLLRGNFIYNGEWWYVFQYLILMIAFPFVDTIVSLLLNCFEKHRKKFIFIGISLIVLLSVGYVFFDSIRAIIRGFTNQLHYNSRRVYLVIFIIGFLCAKLNLFQFDPKGKSKKWIPFVGLVLIVGCFVIRAVMTKDVFYIFTDIFIIVPFVLGLCLLSESMKRTTHLLQAIGKHSTYMWLTHSFYCYYYFRSFITISRISIIMMIQLFVVSLATAVVLSRIENLLDSLIELMKRAVQKKKIA